MKSFTLFLSLVLTASALAGCANDTTTDPATNMTPTTGATPTTPTGEGGDGPPEMMECTGDYVDDDAVGERLGLPELQFTVKDADAADPCFAFVGPRNATAGWTAISLTYPAGGRTFHIMPMYFIGEHTVEEVMQAFATDEEPEWATPVGAVGGVTGGQNGTVVMDLQVGSYMFFCPIEGHMFQGMMGMLNVTAANATRDAPTADAQIDLVDYNFTIPSNLSANVSVIKVENKGAEPHEMPFVKLQGNATAMQFLQAIEDPNATGPPPGSLIGGVNAIAPGEVVYVLVDLEEGARYAFACFVESKKHGVAHLELGMVAEFTAQ